MSGLPPRDPNTMPIGTEHHRRMIAQTRALAARTNALEKRIAAAYAELDTLTTKGDLYVGTGPGAVARKGVGADGRRLTADSTQDDGLDWEGPSGVSGWVTIEKAWGRIAASAATHWFMHGGRLSVQSTADIYAFDTDKGLFYFNPADHAAPPGRTLQYRLKSFIGCNATGIAAPVFNLGLCSIAWINGGASVIQPQPFTVGAYTVSTDYTTAISAFGFHPKLSAGFSLAEGTYMFAFTNHTAIPANTALVISCELQYRHV